jgi:multidrug resistance efflux pump
MTTKNRNPRKIYAKKSQLRRAIEARATSPITDTMTPEVTARLKPLAWLIQRERYTAPELMQCYLAYQEHCAHSKDQSQRARAVLQLIQQRKQQREAGVE